MGILKLFEGDEHKSKNINFFNLKLGSMFKRYFEDYWNYIDIVGCTLFFVGITLRFISLKTNYTIFLYSR